MSVLISPAFLRHTVHLWTQSVRKGARTLDHILQLVRGDPGTEWEVAVQEGRTSECPGLDGRPGELELVFPGVVVKISGGSAQRVTLVWAQVS